MKNKKNNGITLVALVVTIIVLLILVAVSINLVLGDNGIITKGITAKENTEMASIKEKAELALDDLKFEQIFSNMNVDTLTQLRRLNSIFEDSFLQGNKVVVNNGKYDVYVKDLTTVLVKKHPKAKDGDLIVTYDINQYSEENVNITIYVSIEGLELNYEKFALEKLKGKSPEEKEQIFLESFKYANNINEEITIEQVFSKLSTDFGEEINSLEDLVNVLNNKPPIQEPAKININSDSSIRYASLDNKLIAEASSDNQDNKKYADVDDFLIQEELVCTEEFDNILDIYDSVEVIDQDDNIVNAGGYGRYEYVAGENKKYTFTITYEDKQETIELDITGIIQVLTGNGTIESPYIIDSIEGLVSLSKKIDEGHSIRGAHFKLAKDLDFNDDSSYLDSSNTRYGDINGDGKIEAMKKELTTGKGFNPMGNTDLYNAKFTGVFDGNGKEIKNLYIHDNTKETGLFARCEYATIKNLGISGEISGGGSVGAIVGVATQVEFINCYSNANIISDPELQTSYISRNHAGGIVGYSEYDSTINRCYNVGTVYSTNSQEYTYSGGISGYSSGTKFDDCYNIGNITAKGIDFTHAGGISGEGGEFNGCYNAGAITAQKIPSENSVGFTAGGISGGASYHIYNCYNTGNITSAKNAGGISPVQYNNISNCYNTGDIIGDCGVGGIVYYGGSCIQNCYNAGFVKTNNSSYTLSGIVAYAGNKSAIIDNCYSEGSLYNSHARGIVYTLQTGFEGSITNCWYKKGTAALGVASNADKDGVCTSTDTMPVTVLEVLNKLTTNVIEAKFVEDTENINNGYPILNWQVVESE